MGKSQKQQGAAQGRFSYEGLDRVMHEKARLGILTSIITRPEGLLFSELKKLCNLTDGNLSRHIKALEDENLIEVWKRFDKNRPQTLCKLTGEGRRRFLNYIQELEKVVKDASLAGNARGSRSKGEDTGLAMA